MSKLEWPCLEFLDFRKSHIGSNMQLRDAWDSDTSPLAVLFVFYPKEVYEKLFLFCPMIAVSFSFLQPDMKPADGVGLTFNPLLEESP